MQLTYPIFNRYLKYRPFGGPIGASESSETIGKTSSQGTESTNSTPPQEAIQVRSGTDRDNLELNRPLDRAEPVMPPQSTSRGVYAPTQRTNVRKYLVAYTSLGLSMIAMLIFGGIFGVIFAIIKTNGALAAGGTPDYNTSTTAAASPTPSIATTLVLSSFSTLVPSSYSVLVPTEFTVYVPSEATTLVKSDATTLVPSLVTLTQRDITASAQAANFTSIDQVAKSDDVISTTALTSSVTTTVIVATYSTTFGHNNLQGEPDSSGISKQTCGNEGQSACILTTTATPENQVTFVSSTAPVSTLDVDFTTTATGMPDGAAHTTMQTTNIPIISIVEATITTTMVCALTDAWGMRACQPVPTGWYISASAPRASSFLHPVYRFISSCLGQVNGSKAYQSLRVSATTTWMKCCKAFTQEDGCCSDGGGGTEEVTNHNLSSSIHPHLLNSDEMWKPNHQHRVDRHGVDARA